MSHEHDAGGLSVRRPPRPQRPHGRLERPSLFAGMEDDEVDDIEPDRVRLLSTLASREATPGARRRRRSARARRKGQPLWQAPWTSPRASPWWGRGLLIAMSLGVVAVLCSFVQVVRQPHGAPLVAARPEAGTSTRPQALSGKADVAPDLGALPPTAAGPASPVTMPPASADSFARAADATTPDDDLGAPARIEVMPPPREPHPPTTPAATASREDTRRLVAQAAADAERLNAPHTPIARPPAWQEPSPRPRANDDVALLEAMMRHASSRRAPPSVAEALQPCTLLQGAEAAVCRARACVQHPAAPQCHSDTP